MRIAEFVVAAVYDSILEITGERGVFSWLAPSAKTKFSKFYRDTIRLGRRR